MDLETSKKKVDALVSPRNVAIVGASDRPGSWAARVWSNFSSYGFGGKVYFINPKRTQIYDQPCYPDCRSLPEPPDHLAVLVPAQGVVEALKDGAAAGARSATVWAAGFGEDGSAEGRSRRRQLEEVIAASGIAVSGPNCLGNLVGKSRLVTLTDPRPQTVRPGPLAMVGQSGGVVIHLNFVFLERGIVSGYVIGSGNEIGLSTPDYIAYFADDPEVKVIFSYVEAISDVERFKAACAYARKAGKPVVMLKLGSSEAGREAALAHTGALAGSTEVFDAVTGELGAMRADTPDDAVELVELLLYTGAPAGRRMGAITLSGAYRGMLLDAAEKYGLEFPPLAAETEERLHTLLSVGAKVSNPIDGGFGVLSSEETYLACVEALEADPNVDMLLLQEELPRAPGNARTERYAQRVEKLVASRTGKPVAFVSFATHSQTDYSRKLKAGLPHLSFLLEPHKSLRTIASAVRCEELRALARAAVPASGAEPARSAAAKLRQALRADAKVTAPDEARSKAPDAARSKALSEARSKDLIRAFGIATPREAVVNSPQAAVDAAVGIGYPVVLKVVSADILHKSDVGGVRLNLRSAAEVRAAYEGILADLARNAIAAQPEGMLVAGQVDDGLELVLGLHRDPEMGLVVMAGCGGVLLELVRDVAFAAPPISAEKARDMLARTRAGRLLRGYRGAGPYDLDAVVQGLVALGALAVELGDVIQSVDINPFVARAPGKGAVALDALVVLGRASRGG